MFNVIIDAVQQVPSATRPTFGDYVHNFFTSPEQLLYAYLFILLVLWVIARVGRQKQKDFSAEAQKVLDEKFHKGEIDRDAYEKYRQELSMRLKKD